MYALRLVAANACGVSSWGAETMLQVGGQVVLPGAPMALSQHAVGRTATLNWNPPTTGGTVTRYLVEASTPSGDVSFDTGTTSTMFATADVPPGQYIIRVRAGNAAGFGPASAPVTLTVE
jgi:predicted phage tail protein